MVERLLQLVLLAAPAAPSAPPEAPDTPDTPAAPPSGPDRDLDKPGEPGWVPPGWDTPPARPRRSPIPERVIPRKK